MAASRQLDDGTASPALPLLTLNDERATQAQTSAGSASLDLMALVEEALAEVGADEAGTARY